MPELLIKVKKYRCNKCGNEWLPKNQSVKPFTCPKCKSARWDAPAKNKEKKKKPSKIKELEK